MPRLSDCFSGIAAKRLRPVEVGPGISNQHEFNGNRRMAAVFGQNRIKIETDFIFLTDSEEETIAQKGLLTWYDARENHPSRSEFRLYFSENEVMGNALPGDLLLVARRPDGSAILLIVKEKTTVEQQILWLFKLDGSDGLFQAEEMTGDRNREIGFAERLILKTIGIEVAAETEVGWLDILTEKFGDRFPKTNDFSAFARSTLNGIDPVADPDEALISWMNREEMLFRTFENQQVWQRIQAGFEKVDAFIDFSLSVLNKRKSRVGYALENHLEFLFQQHGLVFSKGKFTENRSKPDFLFPGETAYHETDFAAENLTMLGSKSTCKERWRQVLAEAARIEIKHLLTLEPGISRTQTDEMQASKLQLVVPRKIQETYLPEQKTWLMTVADFIKLIKKRHFNSMR